MLVLSGLLPAGAQRYLTDYDSAVFIKDTVRPVMQRFHNLSISGYMQPQFQVAGAAGAAGYAGGHFAPASRSRFMLRRARVKVDYVLPAKDPDFPKAYFAFQVDATERGVALRDMFLRLYAPKHPQASLTVGMFGRPFGYEVNLSSAYRETPERGRMSQILLPGERDLGAMVSYEWPAKAAGHPQFRLDAGVFNGTGVTGVTDFDSYKDVAARLVLKTWAPGGNLRLSGGLSFLDGGWRQHTRYRHTVAPEGNGKAFRVDSALTNVGAKTPRRYYGADVQVALLHGWGKSEWRAEYWRGKQPGTAGTSTSPAVQPVDPTYIRQFDGAFFYFLQTIVNPSWELLLKYDWYDPNRLVAGAEIGAGTAGFSAADVRFSTLGGGLTRSFGDNLKLLAYYDLVRNEDTALPGYGQDLPDDVFTLRLQLRF